ncbi:MAG TPA: hypothetical protein VMZ90_12155 [Vicinamibacterales bacterium]|nr:hypothetical protein [Vicinamibacterales bacterium]
MPNDALRSILGMTASATAATTAAAAMCGSLELGWPAAPLNAVSHMLWGRDAIRHDAASAKYTGLGSALNTAAVASWSVLHHFMFRPDRRPPGMAPALARGAATAAVAYVVDYHVVPKRLTPGFEERLSNRSLFAIYAALAISLAVGERASRS